MGQNVFMGLLNGCGTGSMIIVQVYPHLKLVLMYKCTQLLALYWGSLKRNTTFL